MKSNPILFIIGNPRSGTSLLRIILSNHPNICIPPECGFIVWWYKKYGDFTYSKKTLNSFVEDLKLSKKIETWNLNFSSLLEYLELAKPVDYSELCKLVIAFYARSQGKKVIYVGDKNNYYINELDTISKIFPDAHYLGIIRDGRDVACSYRALNNLETLSIYKPNLPLEIERIAQEWVTNNSSMISFLNENENSKIIRYEDLLINAVKVLKEVSMFLGVDYDKNMLLYYQNSNANEPSATLDWKIKTKEKLDINNHGKFRDILTAEEINRFNQEAHILLKSFNYINE